MATCRGRRSEDPLRHAASLEVQDGSPSGREKLMPPQAMDVDPKMQTATPSAATYGDDHDLNPLSLWTRRLRWHNQPRGRSPLSRSAWSTSARRSCRG